MAASFPVFRLDSFRNLLEMCGPFFLFSIFSVDVQDFSRASGGGWPGTNEDVLMALRRIAELKTEGLEDGEYGDFGR